MPDTTPTTPAVWSDDDPLMQAIATAVYERCELHPEVAVVVDDPRNIAAVAATEARLLLGTTDQQPTTAETDRQTLAAALDGLHTLIATSSRDWQTYRVDAWIWAVLCGWDCEQAEHDDTCTHGALEETAAMHGWDNATVAKARRYRAAVRRVADEAQPAADQPTEADAVATICKCGHPRKRHTLLNGTYAHCRWTYTEAGRGKCFCGMYRPAADQPDTETEAAPQCSAGLLPATDAAVDRCVRRGKHDSHITAAGVRWGNGSADEAQR